MKNSSKSFIPERILFIISIVILLPGIILRFYDLNIDPPQFFTQISRALLTDPYNLTAYARNKVLFGQWDIFDYPRWIAFKYSLSSGFGYLFFSLLGVSRLVANISAIFLNLGGILFFLLGIKRESLKEVIVASLVLIPCMVLAVYGRYPFLENGLIFLSGLLFYLYTKLYPKGWVLFLSGFAVALCMISGKMFGIILLAPIALVIRVEHKKSFFKEFGVVISSWLVSLVLLALVFYGNNIGTVYKYLQEQTVGMYGTPEALTSPLRLMENLMTFGSAVKLYYFSPVLTILLFASFLSIILRSGHADKWLKNNRQLLFCIGWLIGGYLLLMFPNYRPLRYQLFLILPMAGIIAYAMLSKIEDFSLSKLSISRWLLLLYTGCFFVFQFVVILLIGTEASALTPKKILPTILAGILLSIILYKFRRRLLGLLHHRYIFVSALLLVSAGYQYYWLYRWFDDGTHTFQTAGRELEENIGANAAVIGPYAQSLTIDNKLKSFTYMFGLSFQDETLFRKFPFTHMAMDASNFAAAHEVYPAIEKSTEVARYWIRDAEIVVSRIDRKAMGVFETDYKESDYEIALDYLAASELDSAYFSMDRFIKKYPDNRLALLLMPELLIMRGHTDAGFTHLDSALAKFPDDFSVFLKGGFIYYRAFLITRLDRYRIKSEQAFGRAVELNPSIESRISFIKEQARGLSGQSESNP